MAKLSFENLRFRETKDSIEATLLGNFSFHISKKELMEIGSCKVGSNFIEFEDASEKKASAKFNRLISEGIKNLRNRLNSKPAVYIHRNSGIPLIGSLFFGIVDRGSAMIEVKPITSCNINCIFCSVDEGISGSKQSDFVVEEEYLIEELEKLLEFKAHKEMEIFINPHGEPLLYADILKLVGDIRKMEHVNKIAVITNGTLLTKDIVGKLEKAGLDQLNISINSLDRKNSRMIAGTKEYNISRIKGIIDYILSKTIIKLVIAPVWVPGMNDSDIKDIIEYCKEKGIEIGIQKYVMHKKGRKPKDAKEMDWQEFFRELEKLEEKHGPKLVYPCTPKKTKELPKPFNTGDIIKARIACNGRYDNERIGAAKDRAITIYDCAKSIGEEVKVRIIKSKDNVFFGKYIN